MAHCGQTESQSWAFSVKPTDLAASHQDTHIIVVAGGVVNASKLWVSLRDLALARPLLSWTIVDTSPKGRWVSVARSFAGGNYIGLPGMTNIPRAFNIGAARLRHVSYLMFLHDDVKLPKGKEWVRTITEPFRVYPGVGLVVPAIDGEERNPAQNLRLIGGPSFHCPDFVSSAALVTTADHFRAVGGFNDKLDGYDWWQIEFQHKLTRLPKESLGTMVVPAVVFGHAGHGTYKDAPEAGSLSEPYKRNLLLYEQALGSRSEYKSRPTEPRINPAVPGDMKEWSAAFVVDSIAGVKMAIGLDALDGVAKSRYGQIVILDTAGLPEIAEKAKWFENRLRYVLQYSHNPSIQAVGAVSTPYMRLYDLRDGYAYPPPYIEGRRIRIGTEYRLPQQITDFHIGMLQHYAIGDTLVMTNVLHALKRTYPWMRLHVHHGWAASALLENNPDVSSIKVYDMKHFSPSPEVTDIGCGQGGEKAVDGPFDLLGLDKSDKTLRYYIQPEEHQDAVEWLEKAFPGISSEPNPYIVGLQHHGGWKAKRWSRVPEMLKDLLAKGARVVLFGVDADREHALSDGPNIAKCSEEPLRLVFAIIRLLDCMIGYDSGLLWGAIACGTPSVSLWGPLDPRGTMANVGASNFVAIRKRTPEMCQKERGANCRTTHGGSQCPFRQDGLGGDCLDEITVEEVAAEVEKMPRWEEPLAARK